MAPTEDVFARDYYRCSYGWNWNGRQCVRNNWSYWGRWVFSRRRKRRGVKPVYGTGWMAAKPWGNNNNHQMYNYGNQGGYNQGYQQNNGGYGAPPPPPAYGQQQQPQYTGTTFNTNDGYYGQGQYSGVQQPQGTYQRDGAYSPPAGPPPGK
ncbi:Chitin synthesis regulation, Congo red resistance, RCR protein [Fusarium oxysporum f. sp. vasinfectum]|nr:Chitin synthesis regulation, Congo red resistance, RCR protein [Fusarium oxysporum f. sp. vasinfectum]KAK2936033.1 Chitin synthesis regulation, Congo red resistance, RCR protein [Fusarium oxysporum f. sp. vasinfectum]